MAELERQVLVSRDERARKLRVVGRQPLIGVVDGVARKPLAVRRQVVVDAALQEVLVDALALATASDDAGFWPVMSPPSTTTDIGPTDVSPPAPMDSDMPGVGDETLPAEVPRAAVGVQTNMESRFGELDVLMVFSASGLTAVGLGLSAWRVHVRLRS